METTERVRLYLDEGYLARDFAGYALPAGLGDQRWGRDATGLYLTAPLAALRASPLVHDLPVVRVVIETAGGPITAESWYCALAAYADWLRTRQPVASQPDLPERHVTPSLADVRS
jgi:hypothetical protein